MIVLNTNVLSELMKSKPNRSLLHWVGKHEATSLLITTLTQSEILYGLELLPEGKRHSSFKEAARSMFDIDFARRILPFDCDAVQQFAVIAAKRRKIGRPISQIDGIARSHHATWATRNVADFEECGLDIVNPWETVDR